MTGRASITHIMKAAAVLKFDAAVSYARSQDKSKK